MSDQKKSLSWISWLDRHFEEAVCLVCLATLVSCVMTQVVLRFVFSAASPWAEELAVFSMIYAVYAGAALGVRERAHIRITLLIQRLPRLMSVVCVIIADALWLAFVAFMIWQTVLYLELLFNVIYITPGLNIDQKWVQVLLPFFLVLMLLRIVQVYWQWGKGGWKELPL